ncbi:hypothetical protein DY000_02054069 [Brassica cretica]|uniref:Uncharacterized protein n=1 Tax=Brassica cretica TaxID=69181 RepID=A0ABQ7AGZ6_BRACR|nr:hypothetical protein DY000_02054069 [Brassica cretica]
MDGVCSRWVKEALESCGLWSSHGKGKPFIEMATEDGQTRGLKLEDEVVQGNTTKSEIEATLGMSKLVRVVEDKRVIRGLRQGKDECYQLVGRLREVWSELDVVKAHTSNPRCCQERRKQDMNRKPDRWKGGTSCKKGRLRKLSKEWVMKRRAWGKDSKSEHLSDSMSVILKRIKDILQKMAIRECSYSAYMGESVEDGVAGGTTPLDHERGNGSESGEQEQNQEDTGQHDHEETHEVENVAQSSGDEQAESTGTEESEAQSGGNEQGEPTCLGEEAQDIVQAEDQSGARPSRSLDEEGAVWIRSGHSWKGKAPLQPVQACEASQPSRLKHVESTKGGAPKLKRPMSFFPRVKHLGSLDKMLTVWHSLSYAPPSSPNGLISKE